MGSQKPRRLTSTVLGLMLAFSALTVMNITTMVVSAADPPPWDPGHNVTGTEWYENCNITMRNGNLTIKNGGTLIFNNTVTFKIESPNPGDYGIKIEAGGKFEINSDNSDTIIKPGLIPATKTYSFTNSGTLDFL